MDSFLEETLQHYQAACTIYEQIMDDEDDEEDLEKVIPAIRSLYSQSNYRLPKASYCRIEWDNYVKNLTPYQFARRYRMSLPAFNKLLALIEPMYDLNIQLSINSTSGSQPISCTIALHCTLRYLSGCSYLDTIDVVRISESSFYRVIWKIITIINNIEQLNFVLPFPPATNQDVLESLKHVLVHLMDGIVR
jgi:hypothetical protein